MNPEITLPLLKFSLRFVLILKELLSWGLVLYILMSWIRPKPNPLVRFIVRLGHAICAPFAWAKFGVVSFSAIVALLVIEWGGNALIQYLAQLILQVQA